MHGFKVLGWKGKVNTSPPSTYAYILHQWALNGQKQKKNTFFLPLGLIILFG